jgi:hypothetical protein
MTYIQSSCMAVKLRLPTQSQAASKGKASPECTFVSASSLRYVFAIAGAVKPPPLPGRLVVPVKKTSRVLMSW